MKEEVIKNINEILKLLDDTKKITAASISEDVMNGIFVVSEENQNIIRLISELEMKLNGLLTKSPSSPSLNETEFPQTETSVINKPLVPTTGDKNETQALEMESDNIKILKVKENNDTDGFLVPEIEQPVDSLSKIDNLPAENMGTTKPLVPKSQVIGEIINSNKENLPFYGEIYNERRKAASDFIYNSYRIIATHYGFNSSTDIYVYVAPLQIKRGNPNIPIIVHAYSHGNYVTASSYDTKENGHSIVTIEIDDFHLLVRGGFDENGKFVTYILTTGISANQGDKINILSKEEGYTGSNPQGSGHIKFEEDGNIYEIFPLSMTENDYICVLISKEFLDYYVVAKNYGAPKVRIYNNGIQQEIVAGWSGSFFEADIL